MSVTTKSGAVKGTLCALFLFLGLSATAFAETIGVFYDPGVPMISFAAGDVKAALQNKNHTVEMKALTELNASYPNKKVVIALESNSAVKTVLTAQGGTAPTGLVEQGYGLRTTATPQTSYWVLGGDVHGAMYGGFQVAENIKFHGFTGSYDLVEAPFMKERGVKLNIPFDKRSGTYNDDNVTSSSVYQSIKDVWDLTFWQQWFDIQARNRYNMLSLWANSFFTAMVKVDEYPLAALQDVQDSAGTVIIKMSIEEKIVFWQKVMAYGKSRGFKIYFFNWNSYTGSAWKHYPAIKDGDCNSAGTRTFNYKNMLKFFELYPDVDGFGCTAGENMGSCSDGGKASFLWESFGKAMYDFAIRPENKNRTLTFINRLHQVSLDAVMGLQGFKDLNALPNVRFRTSYKYARCTMFSLATPAHWKNQGVAGNLDKYKLRTFLTVRQDDLFFCSWGNPEHMRAFVKGLPSPDKYVEGIYIGSDGFTPTRAFHVKSGPYKNKLELERLWYREMVLGRVCYNPNISDDVFKNQLKLVYPSVDQNKLFAAWSNASKAFSFGHEYIRGSYLNDYNYYPEAQLDGSGFIGKYPCSPVPGSTLTANSGTLVADSVRRMGDAAINALNELAGQSGINPELGIAIKNLQAMACLSVYVGEKIRGIKGGGSAAFKVAACYWLEYTKLMDEMHVGQRFTRTGDVLPTWSSLDKNILGEAGGSAASPCPVKIVNPSVGITPPRTNAISKTPSLRISALSASSITLYLPGEKGFSVEIFSGKGVKVAKLSTLKNNKGVSRFSLGKKLAAGVYMVRLKSVGQSVVRQMNVCCD